MAMVTLTSAGKVPQRPDDLSNHRHRQLIGYIGLVLPILLIFVAIDRDGRGVWSGLDSVSAYYYTGANPLFVGMLVALSLFLFTYHGYKKDESDPENEPNPADRWCALVGAVAAFGVAFFPTEAPKVEGITALTWWKQWMGVAHFASAAVLFGLFAVFCWLFRKKPKGQATADPDKEKRNAVYLICGVVIIVCIVWAAYEGWWRNRSIFWPESVALIFFAISWLVKGYALRSIADVARSLIFPKGPIPDDEHHARK